MIGHIDTFATSGKWRGRGGGGGGAHLEDKHVRSAPLKMNSKIYMSKKDITTT